MRTLVLVSLLVCVMMAAASQVHFRQRGGNFVNRRQGVLSRRCNGCFRRAEAFCHRQHLSHQKCRIETNIRCGHICNRRGHRLPFPHKALNHKK